MEKTDYIQMFLALIATTLHFLFGGWSMALVCLIGLTIFDYLTGMSVAIKKGELDSTRAKEGFVTKCLYFVLIAAMNLVDKGLNLPVPVVMTLASWNLIVSEGISITENLAELNVPISKQLRAAFKRLSDKDHDIDL